MPQKMGWADLDYYLLTRPLTGLDEECGDAGVIVASGDDCFIALIDVLGHGRQAHQIALLVKEHLQKNHGDNLVAMMKDIHSLLMGTRGAVAAICRLDRRTGIVCHVGVGNITTRVLGTQLLSLVPKDGVLGFSMGSPVERRATLYPGDILVLYSDGLKTHFSLEDHPGLFYGSAQQIATHMVDSLGKDTDDASCIVLRYGP